MVQIHFLMNDVMFMDLQSFDIQFEGESDGSIWFENDAMIREKW